MTREGKAGTSLHEIGKFVVENWYYLLGVYTFGGGAEIAEIFRKNYEKVNFPWRFFIKNLQNYLQNVLIFGPKNFPRRYVNLPCLIGIIRQILISLNVSTNSVDFRQNFQNFHLPYKSSFGSNQILLSFMINVSSK